MNLSKANILVTGGAGFLGSAFIRHLLSRIPFEGHIVNLDLLTRGKDLSATEEIEDDPRYSFYNGDVRDTNLLDKIYIDHNFTLVVHFAQESRADVSTNLLGTMQLLEFIRKKKDVHLHVVSMDAAKGVKPIAEHSVLGATGVSTSVSHTCPCFGPYQNPNAFTPSVILACAERRPFTVTTTRANNWMYVEDHSLALTRLLEKGETGKVIRIQGTERISHLDFVYDLIDEMANIVGIDSQIFVDLMQCEEQRIENTLSNGEVLSFQPEWDLQNGLYKTIQWYLDEKSWVEKAKNRYALTSR